MDFSSLNWLRLLYTYYKFPIWHLIKRKSLFLCERLTGRRWMAERLNVGPLERVLNRAGETAQYFWEKLLSASSILSVLKGN